MNGNSSTLFPPRYPGERYDDDGAIPFHKRSYFFHLTFILQTIVQTKAQLQQVFRSIELWSQPKAVWLSLWLFW